MRLSSKLFDKEVTGGGGISADGTPSGGEVLTVTEVAGEIQQQQVKADSVVDDQQDDSVNFDSFLDVKESPLTSTEDKKEQKKEELQVTPKVEEKKTEEKVDAKKDTSKALPVATEKKPTVGRDYSGLPDDIVPLFKTMSNDAFAKLKPMYLESVANQQKVQELTQKLEQGGTKELPASYHEHPQGYVLSPDYAVAQQDANEATAVLDHWREQLDSVRNGATEYTTLARDPQTGQIVFGKPEKVDQRTLSKLESMYFNCNEQNNRFQQKLGTVKETFQQRHQTAVNDLNTYEKNFFQILEDDKHPLVPVYKDTLSKMNPTFRNNPLAPFVAKSVTVIQALASALQQAKSGKTAEAAKKEKVEAAVHRAGPTETASGGEVKKKTDEDVSIDDFNAIKEG